MTTKTLPLVAIILACFLGCGDDAAVDASSPSDAAQDSPMRDAGARVDVPVIPPPACEDTAHELCVSAGARCELRFTDGSGCASACAGIDRLCVESFEDVDGVCDAQRDRSLGCMETGHSSDYCVCGDAIESDAGPVSDAGPAIDSGVDAAMPGELRAFPGAIGFGRNTSGGRGGRVVYVTNLDNDGEGSLRAALGMTGPRTVVFRVGGTINASTQLTVSADNGDLTVAGQTAPGGGIAIRGAEMRILASNVIMRHLRIRPGDDTTESNRDGVRIIAYSGNHTQNVIIDHCSITWAKDENVSLGGIGAGSRVSNVTIQHSIIGENINTHYGLLLWNRSNNITVYGNLFAHNSERNIRSSTCTSSFEMINNVVYGYSAGTSPTYENLFDVVGNLYRTREGLTPRFQSVRLEASTNNCPDGQIGETRAHISDNTFDGGDISVSASLTPYLEDTRIFAESTTMPMPVAGVQDAVLSNVGTTVPASDAVDLRLIQETRDRTGDFVNSVSDAGGYPTLMTGTPYVDSDMDGIDDEWERTNGLDPNDADDGAQDAGGVGYTNLELFLDSLTR